VTTDSSLYCSGCIQSNNVKLYQNLNTKRVFDKHRKDIKTSKFGIEMGIKLEVKIPDLESQKTLHA
jgi:iron only hydrogenase large subunit-like protein